VRGGGRQPGGLEERHVVHGGEPIESRGRSRVIPTPLYSMCISYG
jgi:hypothetical protein